MTNLVDRRIFERYAIELPVEIHFNRIQLAETILNISGGGLLTTCSSDLLEVGQYIYVSISWPSMHQDRPSMHQEMLRKLTRRGRIVRREQGRIAIQWSSTKYQWSRPK